MIFKSEFIMLREMETIWESSEIGDLYIVHLCTTDSEIVCETLGLPHHDTCIDILHVPFTKMEMIVSRCMAHCDQITVRKEW